MVVFPIPLIASKSSTVCGPRIVSSAAAFNNAARLIRTIVLMSTPALCGLPFVGRFLGMGVKDLR